MAKRIRTRKEKKELNNKIAEVIWLVIGGVIFLTGLVFGIMGALIESITGIFKASPLFFIVEAQDKFFAWVVKWWADVPFKTFASSGIVLMLIGLVLLLIILLVFSNKKDILLKKEKARKLRENNIKKFVARLDSNINSEVK